MFGGKTEKSRPGSADGFLYSQVQKFCKPGSVESSHSSGIAVTGNLKRPTRTVAEAETSPQERSLFGLASGGVYNAAPVTGERGALLPHLFTFSRRDVLYRVVCFLLHFPSGRPARDFPGAVFP